MQLVCCTLEMIKRIGWGFIISSAEMISFTVHNQIYSLMNFAIFWCFNFSVLCSLYFCRYIFSTEGHLLPATPQISLVREHCSYLGAYCTSHNSSLRQEPRSPEIYRKSEEANGSGFQRGWGPSALLSGLPDRKASSGSASVKVSVVSALNVPLYVTACAHAFVLVSWCLYFT